jgi:hypothetical protein
LAHNARIHTAVTGWPAGYVVTQADLLAIDTLLFQSLNADLGGTWAPSARVTLGGLGLTLDTTSGNFLVTGSGTANLFSSAIVFSSTTANFFGGAFVVDTTTMTIQGLSIDFGTLSNVVFSNGIDVLLGDVTIDAGSVGITAGDLTLAAGAVTLTAGDLTVGGATIVQGFTALGASALAACTGTSFATPGSAVAMTATTFGTTGAVTSTFAGPVTISNTLTQSGNVTLSGVLTFSGVGSPRYRVIDGADANSTYGINDADVVMIPALGSDRTYTLSGTGATEGARMRFSAQNNTTVKEAIFFGGAMHLRNQSGGILWMDIVYHGGAWVLEAWYQLA